MPRPADPVETAERFSPCACHPLEPANWPWKDAVLKIESCMSVCPYCDTKFTKTSNLKQHLVRSNVYKKRNLTVEESEPGPRSRRAKTSEPSKSSATRSKTPATRQQSGSAIERPEKEAASDRTPSSITPTLQQRLSSRSASAPVESQVQKPERAIKPFPAPLPKLPPNPAVPQLLPLPKVDLSKYLPDSDDKTIKMISGISLSEIDNISEEVRGLWTSSTTTHPRLFPTEECWNEEPPTATKLILSTLDMLEAAKTDPTITYEAIFRGEPVKHIDPRTAITQLYEANDKNPIALIGFHLPILTQKVFSTPLALSEFVEPFDEDDLQLFLTPKHFVTDLHIDSGDGLSASMGACQKTWLTFPPTPHNLALMASAEGQRAKLTRIGAHLEGGIIYNTSSTQAIYLPAGTLHAVYTTQGGFLIAIDFCSAAAVSTFPALFNAELEGTGGGDSFRASVWSRFLGCCEVALSCTQERLAVNAWARAESFIKLWAPDNEAWCVKAKKIWEEWLDTRVTMECPCGEMGETGFAEHWREKHLAFGSDGFAVTRGFKRKRSADGSKSSSKKRKR